MVSFTGGYATGNAVARAAGAKKTLMELGGNGTVVVLPDADVDRAARAVVDGAFGNAGQNCLSVQRVFVARELFDTLVDLVVRATPRTGRRQQEGRPAPTSGPLVDEAAARAGRGLGRRRGRGRRRQSTPEPSATAPSTGPPCSRTSRRRPRVLTEEVFGPVVSIEPFDSVDAVVTEVNRSEYGLQAGVFTRDIDARPRRGPAAAGRAR